MASIMPAVKVSDGGGITIKQEPPSHSPSLSAIPPPPHTATHDITFHLDDQDQESRTASPPSSKIEAYKLITQMKAATMNSYERSNTASSPLPEPAIMSSRAVREEGIDQKKLAILTEKGYARDEAVRFLGRPCNGTATELLLYKKQGPLAQKTSLARGTSYKNLHIYEQDSKSRNWVMLDPYVPAQLLRCLQKDPKQFDADTLLWTASCEAQFLRMLKYAYYDAGHCLEPADIPDLQSQAGADIVTSTSTTAHSSTTASRKSTPPATNRISHKRKRGTPASELLCEPSRFTAEPPVRRHLEYNIVSFSVRNRSFLPPEYDGKRIVYTALGPRWSDDIKPSELAASAMVSQSEPPPAAGAASRTPGRTTQAAKNRPNGRDRLMGEKDLSQGPFNYHGKTQTAPPNTATRSKPARKSSSSGGNEGNTRAATRSSARAAAPRMVQPSSPGMTSPAGAGPPRPARVKQQAPNTTPEKEGMKLRTRIHAPKRGLFSDDGPGDRPRRNVITATFGVGSGARLRAREIVEDSEDDDSMAVDDDSSIVVAAGSLLGDEQGEEAGSGCESSLTEMSSEDGGGGALA